MPTPASARLQQELPCPSVCSSEVRVRCTWPPRSSCQVPTAWPLWKPTWGCRLQGEGRSCRMERAQRHSAGRKLRSSASPLLKAHPQVPSSSLGKLIHCTCPVHFCCSHCDKFKQVLNNLPHFFFLMKSALAYVWQNVSSSGMPAAEAPVQTFLPT